MADWPASLIVSSFREAYRGYWVTRGQESLIRKDGMAYRPWSLLLRPAGCRWAEGRAEQHWMQLLIMIKDKALWCEKYEKLPVSKKCFLPLPHTCPCLGSAKHEDQ